MYAQLLMLLHVLPMKAGCGLHMNNGLWGPISRPFTYLEGGLMKVFLEVVVGLIIAAGFVWIFRTYSGVRLGTAIVALVSIPTVAIVVIMLVILVPQILTSVINHSC